MKINSKEFYIYLSIWLVALFFFLKIFYYQDTKSQSDQFMTKFSDWAELHGTFGEFVLMLFISFTLPATFVLPVIILSELEFHNG